MRMTGWVALMSLVALLGSGCVVDSIVRNQEGEIAGLQGEVNEWRTRAANLSAEIDIKRTEDDLAGPDAQRELQEELQKYGIDVTGDRGALVVTLVNSVLFAPGSAVPKPDAKRALDEIARVVRNRFSDNFIRVEGHTDNVQPKKVAEVYPTNWELSAARAVAVLRYLVSKGIDRDMIYGGAFGDTQPVDTNSTETGRRNNRRVDIVILPPLDVKKKYFR